MIEGLTFYVCISKCHPIVSNPPKGSNLIWHFIFCKASPYLGLQLLSPLKHRGQLVWFPCQKGEIWDRKRLKELCKIPSSLLQVWGSEFRFSKPYYSTHLPAESGYIKCMSMFAFLWSFYTVFSSPNAFSFLFRDPLLIINIDRYFPTYLPQW